MAEQMKFTDKAISTLPLPGAGKRAEFADTEVSGLRIRVSSKGVKTFSLLRRVKNGAMERVTLGRYPDIKTARAQDDAKKIIGAIADGANPAEIKRAHKAEKTFSDLFLDYIERHAKLKKRTWKEDQQKYRDYLEKPLGNKKLSRITRHDLGAIHADITRSGHPTLANRVKDLFSSVFSKAVTWGHMDTNPAKGIEDNTETSRERFLQPGELPRLFAALNAEPNKNFRDFFLLSLLTGARRANVAAMKWADLDLEQFIWTIPGIVSKNGQALKVPVVPEAVEIIKLRKASAHDNAVFVFPAERADSKRGYMTGERKAWLRILKAAGLSDLHIHDLRRTMGSWQARTGASMIIIGKSLGHKSQQATAVYARLDLDPVRQAMETATSAMLEAGGMKSSAEITPIKSKTAA